MFNLIGILHQTHHHYQNGSQALVFLWTIIASAMMAMRKLTNLWLACTSALWMLEQNFGETLMRFRHHGKQLKMNFKPVNFMKTQQKIQLIARFYCKSFFI